MLAALMFLAGCGGLTPLAQLESEALLSGDWSKVDRPERSIALRNQHSFVQQCPDGTTSFCETGAGSKRCACVVVDSVRNMFSQR
jgi:hypothetical protein